MSTDTPAAEPQDTLERLIEQLSLIVAGFESEAMNGVICTPPCSEYGGVGWDDEPSRRWCKRCRDRWARLRQLPSDLRATLSRSGRPEPTPSYGWLLTHLFTRGGCIGAGMWPL